MAFSNSQVQDAFIIEGSIRNVAVHVTVFGIEIVNIGYIFADEGAVEGRARNIIDHLSQDICLIYRIARNFDAVDDGVHLDGVIKRNPFRYVVQRWPYCRKEATGTNDVDVMADIIEIYRIADTHSQLR